VIKSFKDEATQAIWEGQPVRLLPADIQTTARRKLRMLAAAQDVKDLRVPPGNHLEALKSDRKGQFSIRINAQWRICFVWKPDGAHDVEIVDYH
jgi:proteic killer suppression protein